MILREAIYAMAAVRAAIGLAPFVAPAWFARRLGFPEAHDTPTARLLARLFGVRDVGLGALALWTLGDASRLPFVALLQISADLGDLGSALVPLLRRQAIDRAAASTAFFAATGAVAWGAVRVFAC